MIGLKKRDIKKALKAGAKAGGVSCFVCIRGFQDSVSA